VRRLRLTCRAERLLEAIQNLQKHVSAISELVRQSCVDCWVDFQEKVFKESVVVIVIRQSAFQQHWKQHVPCCYSDDVIGCVVLLEGRAALFSRCSAVTVMDVENASQFPSQTYCRLFVDCL